MLGPLAMMHAAFADRFGERREPRPAPKTAADVPLPEPVFYDCYGRGRIRICPETHERTIGGDGYGDRCCGTMDVETIEESAPDCPAGYCDNHCGEKCTHWQEARHCFGYVGCNSDDTSTCECPCAKCAAARAV